MHGPSWLTCPDLDIEEEELEMPVESLQEMKSRDRKLIHSMLVTEKPKISLSQVIDCERFGNLHRLLRVTAYMLKFVRLLKHKVKGSEGTPTKKLSAADVFEAECLWLK